MPPLKLAFMGTPAFALPSLRALAEAGHEIAVVYSQPPRPAGRGQAPRPSPVAALAVERGWKLLTPATLKDPASARDLVLQQLDACVVVAYGLILPRAVLEASRLGSINLHASLLPRWRGAAPIQRAILAGDRETGVSVMLMEEGLDSGPLLLQKALPIRPDATAASLHDLLAAEGAALLPKALADYAAGRIAPRPQPEEGVTYAPKLSREEARLAWQKPAALLERQVRAFDPWPGAWFQARGERIKVLAAEIAEASGGAARPGEVLDEALTVACGEGALRPTKLQRPGRAALKAAEFLRGFPLPPGSLLP